MTTARSRELRATLAACALGVLLALLTATDGGRGMAVAGQATALPLPSAPDPGFRAIHEGRSLVDAHNCYPEHGLWRDRLDRALRTGFPLGIEQDLAWSGAEAVLSHDAKVTGDEPTLREHFFEAVRPLMEAELRQGERARWPLIVLHFDFKDNRPELHRAVWNLLGEYGAWITTAPKTANPGQLAPLTLGPLLVLTEDNDAQEDVFFHALPVGAKLRLFGSAHTTPLSAPSAAGRARLAVTTPPERLLTEKPTNYRRWWNSAWGTVEEGGPPKAGEWTRRDEQRLRALVGHAHRLGFWIRFYTLDGFDEADNRGWNPRYNFGSPGAAALRWKASAAAGVDLIATDQMEALAAALRPLRGGPAARPLRLR